MAYIFRARRGTTAEYLELNRIYADGEILVERGLDEVVRIKIGDGVTAYNSLPYATETATATASFGSVAVVGQSTISADNATDTLNLLGQAGIEITTNAGADTVTFSPVFGTASSTFCQGNDARLSDTRVPTAHAASHKSGQADAIKLDELAPPVDSTTLNASVSAHGLLPKLSGNANQSLLGTGAWGASPAAAISDGIASVKEYGAVGNSTGVGSTGTDDTTAFQNAITACIASGKSLFIPPGVYRITAQLNVTGRITIFGVGTSPYVGIPPYISADRGTGSWLYITHTSIGLAVTNLPDTISGVVFRDWGIIRPQPDPAPGWAPTDHNYDISVGVADILIQNFMCWSSTRGIQLYQNALDGYGKATIDNLRGHFFKNGIYIRDAYDTPRISNVHMWPFWWDNAAYVHSYTLANLWGIYVERSDGLYLHNIFIIFAYAGLLYGQNAYGHGTHLRGQYTNIFCDLCTTGILVELAVTTQLSFQCSNLVTTCPWPSTGHGMRIRGNNCRIDISNWDISFASHTAFQIEGTTNILTINGLRVAGYNWADTGAAAIHCEPGNIIYLGSEPILEDGHTGPVKSGTGSVLKPTMVTI